MEEDKDLEILQRICQCRRFSGVYTDIECIFEAIENLIARYKELETRSDRINQQNKEYQKTLEQLQKDTIWKSKVQEKIEEFKEISKAIRDKAYGENNIKYDLERIDFAVNMLQELLED